MGFVVGSLMVVGGTAIGSAVAAMGSPRLGRWTSGELVA